MKKLVILIPVLLAACASTNDALMRESAISIGTQVDAIQLRDVDRGATKVSWQAVTDKGVYDCTADDMLRRVSCAKK